MEAIERFLCGELLTNREQKKVAEFPQRSAKSRLAAHIYVDQLAHPERHHFLTHKVQDREEWRIGTSRDAWRRFARFLDEECRGDNGEPGVDNDDLELASMPMLGHSEGRVVEDMTPRPRSPAQTLCREDTVQGISASYSFTLASSTTGQGPEPVEKPPAPLRLARLYWRFLLGSAAQQRLHGKDVLSSRLPPLDLGEDGRLGLLSFLSILAPEQLAGLIPKSEKLNVEAVRRGQMLHV